MSKKLAIEQIREAAEADLATFIRLVAPKRLLGSIHEKVIRWWTREGAKNNQILLLPRGHQKSQLIAYRVAWWITKHPEVTIFYLSATADLAEKQLYAIKQILESDIYHRYWPEVINPEEGKREKWSVAEIAVDHPKRKLEGVRDPTVKAVGITSNFTGFHADVVVLDDMVVPNNAYTEEGRDKVAAAYSQLASIENPGALEWVVGTRYHPKDIYSILISMKETVYNRNGEVDREDEVYELLQEVVETDGEFLWPKQMREDGKYFGFDEQELARIRAKYVDKTQFYCFHPDTLVYTDKGNKRIIDLDEKDTFSGNSIKSVFIREQQGEAVELNVSGIPDIIISTKGHKFPINRRTYKKNYGTEEMQLGDIQKCDIRTMRHYLLHRFPTSTIDTPHIDNEDWWLIGHWLAEGYRWKKYLCFVTRLEEEKGIHTKIRDICNNKSVHFFEQDTKSNTKIFYLDYSKLFDYSFQFGYYSHGKFLNEDALHLPESKSRELLGGYLSGDGYKLKQGGYGITSISLRLLEGIKDILLRIGESPYIFSLYKAGYRKAFGYDVRDTYTIRWTPNSKKQKNFIEDGVYYQLVKSVKDCDYNGDVVTCEVENAHKYNVMGLECCNSQYYNNPNTSENSPISRDKFQYYERKILRNDEGDWYYKDKKLNVFAAIDFAFSLKKGSDYTALVVIGVDSDWNSYILEVDRFKTNRISEYFKHIVDAQYKWGFRKIRAEVTVAQESIVEELKESYIKPNGISLAVDKYRPNRQEGAKAERIMSILQPKYDNLQVWHYRGGNCQSLEEELVLAHPPHDDISDALANAIAIANPPRRTHSQLSQGNVVYNSRFGGCSFR